MTLCVTVKMCMCDYIPNHFTVLSLYEMRIKTFTLTRQIMREILPEGEFIYSKL